MSSEYLGLATVVAIAIVILAVAYTAGCDQVVADIEEHQARVVEADETARNGRLQTVVDHGHLFIYRVDRAGSFMHHPACECFGVNNGKDTTGMD